MPIMCATISVAVSQVTCVIMCILSWVRAAQANDGTTPLHLAARNNHENIVKYMLEFINDKNPKDNRGMTPLHLAALNKHENIVNCLLQFAEEKNPKDIKGWTPLRLIGAKYGRWKMLKHAWALMKNKHF